MRKVTRMDKAPRSHRQSGFTILQMLVTVVLIAIVTTFGVLGIKNARAEMRVQNSARRFAVYMEKARADSIRRHAAPGSEAFVQTFGESTSTFNVRMDFDGTGVLQTRTFSLDEGVTFNNPSQTAMFDWRGRIVERLVFQIINEARPIPVDVSGSGDITVGSQVFSDDLIPGVTLAEVVNDVVPDPSPTPTATATPAASPDASPAASPDASPTPTPNGNGNGNGNGSPHSSPSPTPVASPSASPGAYPSPSPVPPACASSVSGGPLTLSQSIANRGTGSVVFTLTNATGTHSISASAAGSGNPLTLSVSPASITGDGSVRVTIGAKNGSGNRGNFTVNISASPTCGATRQVSVSVGN